MTLVEGLVVAGRLTLNLHLNDNPISHAAPLLLSGIYDKSTTVCDAQVREMPRQPPTGSLKRKIHLE